MVSVNISLNTIDKVKEFVRIISSFDGDFDMNSGRYTVDAKSVLGIFSLDLSRPIELVIYKEDEAPKVIEQLNPFILPEAAP